MARKYRTIRIEEDVYQMFRVDVEKEIFRVSPEMVGMPLSMSYKMRRAGKHFLRS